MNKKIMLLTTLLISGNSMATAQAMDWYAGIRAGIAHYSDYSDQGNGDLDDSEHGAGGFYIGRHINDWFAFESGYTYLGKLKSVSGQNITTQSLDLVGKFSYQIAEPWFIFAKLGGAMTYAERDIVQPDSDDLGVVATAGLGIEYYFSEQFSTRLEYQLYQGVQLEDSNTQAEWDTHFIGIGATYHFGQHHIAAATAAPSIANHDIAPSLVAQQTALVTDTPELPPSQIETPVMVVKKIAQVQFDTNQSKLSASAKKQLMVLAAHLAAHPDVQIDVIGHADSRGRSEYNQHLSEQRAQSVSAYLLKQFTISPENINTSGLGESQPIASNATKAGQAQNRRVELHSSTVTITLSVPQS